MSVKKIYKTDDIIKVKIDDTLSHALSMLHSSHDSAFVVDDNNELKGIVNPYYCVIKKSYPSNVKLKNCMFKPPKIQINTPLHEASRIMIQSKVHYLPVYQKEKFIGILSARRILEYIRQNSNVTIKLEDCIKKKKPLITIYDDEFISKALHLFKEYKISKLVVISRDYKLKGILAYFDIISYLSSPKEKKSMNINGDKAPYMKKPLKNFMKTHVITLPLTATLNDAVKLILDKEIGSIVVVDDKKRPTGIITTRDILQTIAEKKQYPKFEIVKKRLSSASERIVNLFKGKVIEQTKKLGAANKIRLLVKEEKSGGLFRAVISFFTADRKIIRVVSEEGHNLSRVFTKILKKMKPRRN